MKTHHAGFTLVEAIIAIAITGIIGAAVAVFMRGPIDAYAAQSQRAEMVDVADTALRRMARELRLSVPNTARVSGGSLEFLLARAGGRYRFDPVDEDCFTVGCTSLVTRGSVVASNGEFVGNQVVIYNQYNNPGVVSDCGDANPSAYCGQNTSTITGTTDGGATDTITFTNKKFVPENGSDSRRLIIFQDPVTYACSAGQLLRYSGYAINAVQQPTPAVTAAVLATNVDCAQTFFVYTPGTYETWGVVGMTLTLSRNGETITLYHEAHIDNAP